MPLLAPLWTQPGLGEVDSVYTLSQDRTGLLEPLFSRAGVLDVGAGQLRVTQRGAGANMSVDVAAGRCAIRGDMVADQGTYLCTSTAVENRSVSRPSSGSRAYRIVARVRDAAATGETGSEWQIDSNYRSGTTPPDAPDSAISLATIVLTSSTSSITNAMITDTRRRASVGTAALTGTWGQTGFADVWGNTDSTRPLTWLKNPDGWVTLGGWIARRYESSFVGKNEFWSWDRQRGWGVGQAVLPPEIRPVGGVRDTITITSNGDLHLVFFPSGQMNYRFQYDTTLAVGQYPTWVSFDGVSYRSASRF